MTTIIQGALAPSRRAAIALLTVLAVASGHSMAGVDLETGMTSPDAEFVPGTNESFEVTVTNIGDADATGVELVYAVPTGASVNNWVCDSGASTGSCPNPTSTSDTSPQFSLDQGDIVVFTLSVAIDSNVQSPTLSNTVTASSNQADDDGTDNAATVDLTRAAEVDLVPAFDPASPTTAPTASYTPGALDDVVTVTVDNNGPSDAFGASLTIDIPEGVATVDWVCTGCDAGSGSGSVSDANTDFAAGTEEISVDYDAADGASISVELTIDYRSDAQGDPLVFGATTSHPEDTDTGNDTAETALARDAQVDLATSLSPASAPVNNPQEDTYEKYVPGTVNNALEVTVTNDGPSDAVAAALEVQLPPEVERVDWTCAACTTSSGFLERPSAGSDWPLEIGYDLADGASLTVSLAIDYDSAGLEPEIDIVATATPADGETDPDATDTSPDHVATNRYAIDRQVDIEVLKEANAETVNPLDAFFYTITVTNHGPSDLGQGATPGVLLSDIVPGELEADPGNCSNSTDGPCFFVCPSDEGVNGTTVGTETDADCPVTIQERRGNLDDEELQVSAGSTNVVRLYVRLNDQLANGETLTNTATVALSDADNVREPTTATQPNSSDDSIKVEIAADLVVTKEDGLDQDALESAAPGEEISYTVAVTNTGRQRADGVRVTDELPIYNGTDVLAGFETGSVRWQCRAFDDACCGIGACGVSGPTPVTFGDSLEQLVDLPGQGRVEFTITGRIDPRSTGTEFQNTAEAVLPDGIVEDDDTDNKDTDTTLIDPVAGLSIRKELIAIQPALDSSGQRLGAGPPYELNYRIEVSNAGPSFAFAAEVSDLLNDANLDNATATWECSILSGAEDGTTCPANGSGPLDALVDLSVGGRVLFDLDVDTESSATGVVQNTAEVRDEGGDAAVNITSSLTGKADLSIIKTDGVTSATPGTAHQYTILVKNQGPDPVFGARVLDAVPPELENVAWTCEATTPIPGDLSFRAVSGATGRRAFDLAVTADGRHIYQVQVAEADSTGQVTAAAQIQAYVRDNVRGSTFGAVNPLEREVNGQDDGTDPGGTVVDMDEPVDLVLGSDQRHVYVLSNPDEAVSDAPPNAVTVFARSIDPAADNFGELSFNGSATEGIPADARAIAVTADNLYVAGDDGVAVYSLNPSSGLPTFIETTTTGMPADPAVLAVDAADDLLFVGSGTGSEIAAFPMNNDDSTGDPIGVLGSEALRVTVTGAASGFVDLDVYDGADHLYATGSGQVALVDYSDFDNIGQANYTVADIVAATISPDGEHLLTVSETDALTYFRRDRTSGTLSEEIVLAGSDNQGLLSPSSLVVTDDGRHVLISSSFGIDGETGDASNPLTVYSRRAPDPLFDLIETDEHLAKASPTSSALIDSLESPTDLAISPDGEHVYAVSLSQGAIGVFKRTSGAGLTEATAGEHLEFIGSEFNGDGVTGMSAPRFVLVSPSGDQVYVTSENGDSLAVFDREDDSTQPSFGQLTFRESFVDGGSDGNGGVIDGLAGARGMAMDRSGDHLYVAGRFDAAVAVFARGTDGSLDWIGVVKNAEDRFQGLGGIRDLVMSEDDRQVIGVSSDSSPTGRSSAVVVMNRDDNTGLLTFLQKLETGVGDQPMSVDASPDGRHVYVASQNSDSISVLRRDTDPASSSFGTLFPVAQHFNGAEGIEYMDGPRSIVVSPDGNRVYVGVEFDSSLLVFDRDTNSSSAEFGTLSLSSVSRDGIDSIDGLDTVYAVAVSPDSRNVYVAGFRDQAVASFVLGIGSVCSSGGSGSIDDVVTIGRNGTLEYRITADIRPDATGTLSNTATVLPPVNVIDCDLTSDPVACDDPIDPATAVDLGNNEATDDDTQLDPEADLVLTKTNDRVSVVAGETVTYEIEVTNRGPSNLSWSEANPLTVTDLLGDKPWFEADSVRWTCEAEGSGALSFAEAIIENNDPADPGPNLGLEGVASLTLVPDSDGDGPMPALLASVGVVDDSLTLFSRDPGDGALTVEAVVSDGDTLGADLVDTLAGARSVAASPDGAFLYVASQVDDALTVFETEYDTGGDPVTTSDDVIRLVLVASVAGTRGLDQASHVTLDASGRFIFVASTNDDAIAVFEHDRAADSLSLVDLEIDGVDDGSDTGPAVQGLNGITQVAIAPSGDQLYAVSATGQAVSRFSLDASTGELSFADSDTAAGLDVDLSGAAALAMDPLGEHLYISAGAADRIVVLSRDADPLSGTYGMVSKVAEVVQGAGGVTGLLGPRGMQLSDDGLHLYVASRTSGAVTWFLRDRSSGKLDFGGVLTNQSSFVSGMAGAGAVAVDSVGGQVYVAGTLDAAVVRFQRQSDSACAASGNAQLDDVPIDIAAGGTVRFLVSVRISPDAADHLGTDGLLKNDARVDAPPGTDPDTDNNQASDGDPVEVVADLRITKDDGRAEYDGLDGARALAGDARSVYAAGRDDDAIGIFARTDNPGDPDEHGRLRFIGVARNGAAGVDGLTDVSALALSADGGHLYAVSPADNALVAFARQPNTGLLDFIVDRRNGTLGVSGIGGATDVALSADDEHVYVAGALDNSIAVFDRDADPLSATFGELVFLGQQQNGVSGVIGLTEVDALAVSGDGLHVYAVSPADDSVVAFVRNPNPGSASFGTLSFLARYVENDAVAGLVGATDIAIADNDVDVYVLGAATGTLARFQRDPGTGELAFVEFKQDGTAGTTGLTGASAMRISPDGAHLYVAGTDADAVVRFSIAADGSLEFGGIVRNGDSLAAGGQIIGLDGVSDVLISPDGDQAYTAADVDDALATLARSHSSDPAANTGELSYRDVLIDGLGGVAPGSEVVYTIIVENLGPGDVANATVIDDFPDSFSAVSWECTPSANPPSACRSGINNGSINDTAVELPAGGSVTYSATAVVREDATGRLVNTATVTGVDVQDPVIANNSATDDDTVLSPSIDVVTSVDDGLTIATPGAPLEYTVSIRNVGPSLATDVRVRDAVPAALFDVAWSCSALPVEGLLTPIQATSSALDSASAMSVPGNGGFAYAVGSAGGTGAIAVFQRDSVTGRLSLLETYREGDATADSGPAIQGLQGPADIVGSANGAFLYVAASASDSVLAFSRDPESGLLTFIAQYRDGDVSIDGLGGVAELELGPRGNYLYAAGRIDDAIAVFAVDSSTGALSYAGQASQGDSGVDGLNGVSGLAWRDPYLFAVADENASLAAFEQDPGTGLLTPAGIVQNFELAPPTTPASLNGPSDVLVAGDQIVVAASTGDAISTFTFDAERSPAFERTAVVAGVAGMEAPEALAYTPRQQRLYVASTGGAAIHLFSLRAEQPELLAQYESGAVSELAGLTGIALPLDDGPLYSFADPGALGVLARQAGSLCPLSGEDELGDHAVEITPGGELVYTVRGTVFANATGTLTYEVGADSRFVERELNAGDNIDTDVDTLTPATDLVVAKTDGLAEVVAGTPISYGIDISNGGPSDALRAAFVDQPPIHPTDPGLVSGAASWTCSTNEPLAGAFGLGSTDIAELPGLARLRSNPDGSRLLVANPALDALVILAVQPDGTLSVEETISDGQTLGTETIAGMAGASAAAESSDGRSVYVTGEAADSLVVLTREDNGLAFEQRFQSGQDGVSGLQGPKDVILSADEAFVFVAAAGSDSITVFSRDADTGRLTFVERVRDGFDTIVPDSNVIVGVRRLVASGDGRHLHALAPASNSIATFEVDPDDGTLTYLRALQTGDPGATGLGDTVEFVVSPGDGHLYVASPSDGSIVIYQRDEATGILTLQGTADAGGTPFSPLDLSIDAEGERLYATGSDGSLHLFARDWADGSLEHRLVLRASDAVPAAPSALAQVGFADTVYVGDGDAGVLQAFGELPLGRCLTESGLSDSISIDVDLGVGATGALTYDSLVHPAARGELINLATLMPTSGSDGDVADNAATDSTTVIAVSDLGVSKTGPAEAVAGETIAYDIRVTNAGPSDALGIRVADTPPVQLTAVEWTCTPTAGSVCPTGGSGAPDFTATVRVGGELAVTVQGVIDPGYIGTMTNSVALTPEVGATDPPPLDHDDSVVTDVVARADVAVGKSTLTTPVVAGLPVEYAVSVTNNGPSDAPVVDIGDTLPPALSGASWTCSGSGGATCPATGTGAPAFTVDLPAGSAIEILLDGQVPFSATGTLRNVAEAVVAAPVDDLDPSNNVAETSDAIEVRADTALDLTAPLNPFDPAGGSDLPVEVTVSNAGPSKARDLDVVLDFSAPVRQTQPGCTQPAPNRVRCLISQLDPAASRTLSLAFDRLPTAPATLVINGELTTRAEELDPIDNVDSVSVRLRTGSDLDVRIDNGTTWLSPDEETAYTVRVRNIGSRGAAGASVSVSDDPNLLDQAWTCAAAGGAVCSASGSGAFTDNVDVPPGGELTYDVSARVDPLVDLSVPLSITLTASAETAPAGDDINAANNTAVDQDDVRLVMFSDGFESVAVARASSGTMDSTAACHETGIAASTLAKLPAGRVVEGVLDDGRAVYWLSQSRLGSRHWLQLGSMTAAGFETSGWQAWPPDAERAVIRLENGRPSLRFDTVYVWRAGSSLGAGELRVKQRRGPVEDVQPVFVDCAAAQSPMAGGR